MGAAGVVYVAAGSWVRYQVYGPSTYYDELEGSVKGCGD